MLHSPVTQALEAGSASLSGTSQSCARIGLCTNIWYLFNIPTASDDDEIKREMSTLELTVGLNKVLVLSLMMTTCNVVHLCE
jgi:hypothetical protein